MTARIPLTFQQQWLWDLLQQHSDWQCVLGYAYRVSGRLDTMKLRGCIEAVISRHGALRTRVVSVDRALCQAIDPPGPFSLDVVAAQDDETAQSLAKEFTGRP